MTDYLSMQGLKLNRVSKGGYWTPAIHSWSSAHIIQQLWVSVARQSKALLRSKSHISSPNLMALGMSMGYETWPPIGCYHAFVIGWSKYRLGLPSVPLHCGLTSQADIPTTFQTSVTVPGCARGLWKSLINVVACRLWRKTAVQYRPQVTIAFSLNV